MPVTSRRTRRFLFILLLFTAFSYFLSPVSAADVLTKDDLLSLSLKDGKRYSGGLPSGLAWAQQGASLIVSLPGKNGEPTAIFLMDPETGKTEKLVEGSRPILSPDGNMLAYAGPDGAIIVGTLSGSTIKQITTLATRPGEGEGVRVFTGLDDIAFAPDDNQLAYIRYGSLDQKDGQWWATAIEPEIWVHDLDNEQAHRVFAPPPRPKVDTFVNQTQLSGLAYGPNGRIYFGQGFGARRTGLDTHIFHIDEGGAPVMLAEDVRNYAVNLRLRLAADGDYLVSDYSPDPDFMNYGLMGGVAVFDTATGQRTVFDLDSWVAASSWAADGQVLFGCRPPGAYQGDLCIGDIKTGEVQRTMLEPAAYIYSPSVSPDSQRVAWVSSDRTGTTRIRVSNIDGRDARTLWQDNPIDLTEKRLGQTGMVRWTSFDGLELEGVLILPVGYEPGAPVPMIVDLHGGPNGGVHLNGSLLNSTPLEHQLWAGMGFAVFLADYRKAGVARYDLETTRRHPSMNFDEADAADVIAGIQCLIGIGLADSTRIVGIGHSAGSTVLNQLITQSDILAVAISKEGIYEYRNMEALKEGRDANPSQYDSALYTLRARPETLSEWAEKSSPIVYADQIKAPLLLITAGYNTVASIERQRKGADGFVGAINEAGGTAELLFFPDDFHVISKEKNVRAMLETTLDWIERYIPASGPESSRQENTMESKCEMLQQQEVANDKHAIQKAANQ